MRTFLLRSMESALRRGGAASSSTPSSHILCRSFSVESAPERKVAVLGAAGGIGQPLALLMKLNPLVSRLALYDIMGIPGVAADVSHINTRAGVKGYMDEEQLGQPQEELLHSKLVVTALIDELEKLRSPYRLPCRIRSSTASRSRRTSSRAAT